jgi:hypothetical protein
VVAVAAAAAAAVVATAAALALVVLGARCVQHLSVRPPRGKKKHHMDGYLSMTCRQQGTFSVLQRL